MNSSPSTVDHQVKKPAARIGSERVSDVWPLSGKPYFCIVLKSLHLAKFQLTIPRHVSEKLPVSETPAKIAYRGKVWDLIYLGKTGGSSSKFESQTWAKFVKENNLEIGDSCVFELMEGSCSSTSIMFKLQVLKDEFPTELRENAKGSNAKDPISID